MSLPESRRLDFAEVPLVDLSPLAGGDDSANTIEAISTACRDVGFFYISGHGVPQTVVTDLYREAVRYFQLPLKERTAHQLDDTLRGYLPLNYRSYEGEPRAGTSHQEGFWIGHDVPRDPDHPLNAPNRWPASQPELRVTMLRYFEALEAVSQVLIRAFAVALGIAPALLAAQFEAPNSRLKLNHYPPQKDPRSFNDIGVVPHADSGAFTILWQDDRSGLEVETRNGEWIGAPPVDDTFIVNIGNVMQIWSDGYFRSTPHRVVNRSGTERYSIPLFVNPRNDAPVAAFKDHTDSSTATDYATYQRAIWARTFPIAGIVL